MEQVIWYPAHNTIKLTGKKLLPRFAKLINDTMYDLSGIEGLYKYEHSGSTTEFSIYPESYDFGDQPNEMKNSLRLYQKVYEDVVTKHPECIVQ